MQCDYLTFTVPYEWGNAVVVLLALDGVRLDHGRSGYSEVVSLPGDGWYGWNPARPEMGWHFSFGAQALGALRALNDTLTVEALLDVVWSCDGHICRLDVAIDDYSGAFTVDDLRAKVVAGEISSRWRVGRRVEQILGGNGDSVYLGSGSSNSLLRCYDKAEEQANKGQWNPIVDGPWVRVEFQFRRESAEAVARVFVESGIDGLRPVLLGYLDVKEAVETDSNSRRWPTVSWWAALLGLVKEGLGLPGNPITVARVRDWIETQVAPTLVAMREALGGDEFWSWIAQDVLTAKMNKRGELLVKSALGAAGG
jgi:hypothetical protein